MPKGTWQIDLIFFETRHQREERFYLMAKDPAVLFYTSDFLSGTSFFTNEQIGQYIKLLCQQHQLGSIPKNHMISVCGSDDSPVFKKFQLDEHGNYFNERMRFEAEKRRKYCESRKNNKSGRPKGSKNKKSYDKTHDNHMLPHMENENVNENINNIFNHYTKTFSKNKAYKLTAERKRLIKNALKRHEFDMVVKAIDGMASDDWIERPKFNDLKYAIGIISKTDNVEKWASYEPTERKSDYETEGEDYGEAGTFTL